MRRERAETVLYAERHAVWLVTVVVGGLFMCWFFCMVE